MRAILKLVPCLMPMERNRAVYANNIYKISQVIKSDFGGTEVLLVNEAHETVVNLEQVKEIYCEYRDGVACAGEDRERIYDIPLRYDFYEEAIKLVGQKVDITLMDAMGVSSENNNPKTSVAILLKDYNWDDIFLEYYGKDYKRQKENKDFFVWISNNFQPPKRK